MNRHYEYRIQYHTFDSGSPTNGEVNGERSIEIFRNGGLIAKIYHNKKVPYFIFHIIYIPNCCRKFDFLNKRYPTLENLLDDLDIVVTDSLWGKVVL